MDLLTPLWNAIKPYLNPESILVAGLVWLILSLKSRATLFINDTTKKLSQHEEKFEIYNNRVDKIVSVISECPSVHRDTEAWIKNDSFKGGIPPKPSQCYKKSLSKIHQILSPIDDEEDSISPKEK